MSTTKPCCPNCRSTELRIVGCVLLGPEGVALTDDVSPELFLSNDFAVTRELVRCNECSHRATLDDARTAADLPTTNVLWEDTRHNIKRPVVCPACGNAEHFVREVIRVKRESEYVYVEESCAVVKDPGGDPELLEEIRLQYQCAADNCEGVILLHTGEFVLTPGF